MEYCFAVAEVIPLRTTASNRFHSARSVGSSGCREVLRCDAGLPRRGINLQPEEGVLQMFVVVQVWAGIHYEASLRSSRGDLCLQPRAGVLQMSVEVQLCPGIHYERWPRSTLEELCLQPEEGVLEMRFTCAAWCYTLGCSFFHRNSQATSLLVCVGRGDPCVHFSVYLVAANCVVKRRATDVKMVQHTHVFVWDWVKRSVVCYCKYLLVFRH